MKELALTAITTVFLLSGCSKPTTTVVGTSQPGSASVPIHPAPFHERNETAGDVAPVAPAPTNVVRWDVTIARIPEESIGQYGLAQFFARAAETNEVISAEVDNNVLSQLARGDTNIVFDSRAAVIAGTCDFTVASNLLDQLQRDGRDVISLPQAVTVGTNLGKVESVNSLTIFTGASSNSNRSTPFVTNLWFGHTVSVELQGFSSTGLVVQAAARDNRFRGYDRDEKEWVSQYMIGHRPIFGLTVLGTRTTLQTNEVLLLGSTTDFEVTKMISRVPKLSRLPRIGRYFTKVDAQTNFFRTFVVIRADQE